MRMKAAFTVLAVVLVAGATGCGSTRPAATTVQTVTHAAPRQGLPVGVVGPLDVRVPGAIVVHGPLERLASDRLVVVSAEASDVATVAAAAAAHPATHYALVGGTIRGKHRANLAGVVLRDDQAAFLGGIVAGLVATEEGGASKRIAWVGPQETALAAAFARGAHSIDASIEVLHTWSRNAPAACKEAALGATGRGAVVVMAHTGRCAEAAISGSHQANHVGLRLADFELPSVAATQIVREAVAGVFHGGEDIVFGAASGAIGVSQLDPRISATTAIAAGTAAQDFARRLRPSR
jgi:basic membrane lipoprotein Med (substrate-binding protein (PBP1-ABC) superfamily)